jgi:DNA-binding GntR family transcriptional regulator
MPEQGLNKLEGVRLLPERIADELREAILRGRVQPGEHLREAAIAEQLGVSAAPIREAFHLLEREGLIDTLPHRGKFVRAFSERESNDLNRVRVALDTLAYEMINEQGGLAAEAQQLLEQDIADVRAASEAKNLYLVAELDLRFHDHIHQLTGSAALQGVWQTLRTRLHLFFHWRLTVAPDGGGLPAYEAHRIALDKLRKRDAT